MIYFHIPFCKQACHYCDFHFSTSLKYKDEMLNMLYKEVELRADYLEDKNIQSIYFGGGTPSILEPEDIARLIDKVSKHFEIDSQVEITLEANPDDLNREKVAKLRQTEINRFSIGIQSFFEEDLRWMNRAHNQKEAESCIMRVQDAGFENISCDLIYGFPLLTDEKWKTNMQKLLDFQIPHISSYSMTVEKKTALDHMIKTGKAPAIDSDQAADQMLMLIDQLKTAGFEQYEISNFAKDGMYAKHNTNYWKGKHYLGIGPSAHSFNGTSRSWNIANNAKYIQDMAQDKLPLETEQLSLLDRINEYTMTSLRTMWGINLALVEDKFGAEVKKQLLINSEAFIYNKQLTQVDNRLTLSDTGKLMANHIMSELFIIDENSQYE